MEIKTHVLTSKQSELRSDANRQKTARDNINAAKKVSNAVAGHIAGLNANGDPVDSGIPANTVIQGVKTQVGDGPVKDLPIDLQGKVLVNIPEQEQADWKQTDETKLDYIKNKPGEFKGIGTSGFVPTPKAGDENKVLASDGSWAEIVIPEQEQADWKQTDETKLDYIKNKPGEFNGIGTSGFVPTPKAGDENKVLASDGSWAEIVIPEQEQADWEQSDPSAINYIKNKPGLYQGATAESKGVAGFVPPAETSEREMFLRGDGSWAQVTNTRPCTVAEMDSWIDEVENG